MAFAKKKEMALVNRLAAQMAVHFLLLTTVTLNDVNIFSNHSIAHLISKDRQQWMRILSFIWVTHQGNVFFSVYFAKPFESPFVRNTSSTHSKASKGWGKLKQEATFVAFNTGLIQPLHWCICPNTVSIAVTQQWHVFHFLFRASQASGSLNELTQMRNRNDSLVGIITPEFQTIRSERANPSEGCPPRYLKVKIVG